MLRDLKMHSINRRDILALEPVSELVSEWVSQSQTESNVKGES